MHRRKQITRNDEKLFEARTESKKFVLTTELTHLAPSNTDSNTNRAMQLHVLIEYMSVWVREKDAFPIW